MGKKSKKQQQNRKHPTVNNSSPQSQTHQAQPSGIRRVEARLESFQGPLPPPSLLKEYNDILQGSAERIFAMAEHQAIHRQLLEKTVIESDVRNSEKGLKYGLIVVLTGLAVSVLLALTGHDSVAMMIGGLDLAGLAGIFVYATTSRRAERAKKADQMKQAIQGQSPS